jgi:flavin-dependent dehydrogenase
MGRGDVSRVAVIGGGPAGSFFALHLLRFARAQALSPTVHIYEPKDFALAGPSGCNRCAGILSSSLLNNLQQLGLEIAVGAIQGRISIYSIHSPFGVMEVENPSPGEVIYSVYRGSGPLRFPLSPATSFDAFLLNEAKKAGAVVLPKRVRGLRLAPRPGVEVDAGWAEYDVVVLATGVNGSTPLVRGLDYRPPPTHRMAQDELVARREDVQEAFGDRVRVFLFPRSNLLFGTLVPKGPCVNVSLLAHDGVPSVDEFLSNPLVKETLSFPYERGCGCKPLISVGMARRPFGDGFVAVGDAAVTRLYKDGIGAAFLTARHAAHTIVHFGPSDEAFRRHYFPFLLRLHWDNRWGRMLFSVHRRLKDSPAFFRAQAHLLAEERRRHGPYPYHRTLWGIFTGSYRYGEILRTSLKPAFLAHLGLTAAREKLTGERPAPAQGQWLGKEPEP